MILDEHRERIRKHLILDEGVRLKPYTDTVGKLTIGIGRNLTDVGISYLEAYALLDHDMDRAIVACVSKFPWFEEQDPVRQAVLVELMFNMGPAGLGTFVNTLAAFQRKDYATAATGLRASKWYRQVQPSRSKRLVDMTQFGEWL